MGKRFERTRLLIGNNAALSLKKAHVAIFGVGGVGSYVAEALARSGVYNIDLIDYDTVCKSNINRQIIALTSTLGKYKTDVMSQRIKDINPDAEVMCRNEFFLPENADTYDLSIYDYVIDAMDNVSAKIELIKRCKQLGTPIISSMGTANKLDATKFVITDIYKTYACPLARVMRRELKKRNINELKVLYSQAEIVKPKPDENGNIINATISYVPSVAGLLIAGEVIRDLISDNTKGESNGNKNVAK